MSAKQPTHGRRPGWRLLATATLLSALVSLGFSIAGLIDPALIAPDAVPALTAPFAAYAVSRSVAIALAAVITLARRSAPALVTVGWIAGGVQAFDALVGIANRDFGKTIGPAILASFSVYALIRFGRPAPRDRQPF